MVGCRASHQISMSLGYNWQHVTWYWALTMTWSFDHQSLGEAPWKVGATSISQAVGGYHQWKGDQAPMIKNWSSMLVNVTGELSISKLQGCDFKVLARSHELYHPGALISAHSTLSTITALQVSGQNTVAQRHWWQPPWQGKHPWFIMVPWQKKTPLCWYQSYQQKETSMINRLRWILSKFMMNITSFLIIG